VVSLSLEKEIGIKEVGGGSYGTGRVADVFLSRPVDSKPLLENTL
jgi:hypothetical protein